MDSSISPGRLEINFKENCQLYPIAKKRANSIVPRDTTCKKIRNGVWTRERCCSTQLKESRSVPTVEFEDRLRRRRQCLGNLKNSTTLLIGCVPQRISRFVTWLETSIWLGIKVLLVGNVTIESCQFHKLDCLPMFLFPAAASGVVQKLVAQTIKVSICFRWICYNWKGQLCWSPVWTIFIRQGVAAFK